MSYTSGLAKDYHPDGSGVIYLGEKATDLDLVRNAIDEIAQGTEIVTDNSPVAAKVKPFIKDMIKLLNWKDAMEEGILVDYGKVKLKELKATLIWQRTARSPRSLGGTTSLTSRPTSIRTSSFSRRMTLKGCPFTSLRTRAST